MNDDTFYVHLPDAAASDSNNPVMLVELIPQLKQDNLSKWADQGCLVVPDSVQVGLQRVFRSTPETLVLVVVVEFRQVPNTGSVIESIMRVIAGLFVDQNGTTVCVPFHRATRSGGFPRRAGN
jgi:hypothetical protein